MAADGNHFYLKIHNSHHANMLICWMFPGSNEGFDLYPCRCWPRWSHFVAWLAWTWHVCRLCFIMFQNGPNRRSCTVVGLLWFPNIPSTYQGIWPSDFLSSRCVDILRSLNEKNDTDYIIGGDRIVTINGSFLAPATIVSWLSLVVQGKQGKCDCRWPGKQLVSLMKHALFDEPEAKELAGDEYQLMLYRYLPQEVNKDWHISTKEVWRMNFRRSQTFKKNGKDGSLGVAMWLLETMI